MATPVTKHPASGSTLEQERDRFNGNAALRNARTIATITNADSPFTVPNYVGDPEVDVDLYLIDDSAGAVVVNLPAVSDKPGRPLGFQLQNGTNGATINRDGTDTLQTATSSSLATVWELLEILAGETDTWHVLYKGVTAA